MLHLSAGLLGRHAARRATAAFSTASARMSSHGHEVADSVDMSKPMYWDRRDTPLPDRAYKDVLTTADNSLKRKEKGPWGQLTKEEKIALYRLAFHQTFPEMKQKSNEWKTVMGGIFIFMGLTGLVTWWQSIYGKSSPPFFFPPNFMDLISQFQCRKEPLERTLKGKDDDKPSACHVLTLAL